MMVTHHCRELMPVPPTLSMESSGVETSWGGTFGRIPAGKPCWDGTVLGSDAEVLSQGCGLPPR